MGTLGSEATEENIPGTESNVSFFLVLMLFYFLPKYIVTATFSNDLFTKL
jgi:hypothetical protein